MATPLIVISPTVTASPTPSPTPPPPTPAPAPSSEPTYVLKGFLSCDQLANNTVNLIAPFGELSTYSETYSTDRGIYEGGGGEFPEVTLTTFLSGTTTPLDPSNTEADTGNTNFMTPSEPENVFTSVAINIGTFFYSQVVTNSLPSDASTIISNLLAEFPSDISTVTLGPIDENVQGTSSMPEWISYIQITAGATTPNYVRLWFSDSAFRQQYDQYTIRVVPPLANLDDFFQTPSSKVIAEIQTITIENLMTQAQAIANFQPYTLITSYNFPYLNPANPIESNPANLTPVPWTVLVYGYAGNNIDSIKQALIDYILANSTHNQSQWAAIFPDLFDTTEFIITPMWDQYAVPNMTLEAGVYSPIVNSSSAQAIAGQTAVGPNYTQIYVNQYADIVSSAYKSMAFISVGSPSNRNGMNKLINVFPDYMAVNTASPDFNRMQIATQQWIILLNKLFMVAETMTQYTDVPPGITRLIRGTMIYAVANYNDIDYLVVSKQSLETIVPDTSGGVPVPSGNNPPPTPTPSPSPTPTGGGTTPVPVSAPPPVPAADGTEAHFISVSNGLQVTFTDGSNAGVNVALISWSWNFGDGLGTSALMNPTYTYATPGTYIVSLTVTDNGGSTAVTYALVTVAASATPSPTPTPSPSPTPTPTPAPAPTPTTPPPVAGADGTTAAAAVSSQSGFLISFAGTATPAAGKSITSWSWDFGDSSGSSTEQNPQYHYGAVGTYTVRVEAVDNAGDTAIGYCSVTVTYPPGYTPPPPPSAAVDGTTANFNFTVAPGTLVASFTDATVVPTGVSISEWIWSFGDGTGTSSVQNPSYTYSAPGAYGVQLTVEDSNGQQSVYYREVLVSGS